MSKTLHVITGASGLLGGYLAEQLADQGTAVRCLVRPTSDRRWLDTLDVEIKTGQLDDGDFLRDCFAGADTIYHCASKLGNWGRWEDYEASIITATRHVSEAAVAARVRRLLHVSSVACYGHPDTSRGSVTEEDRLGQDLWIWDYYNRAKIAAEEIVAALGDQATIVRPTWIYGPRDLKVIPRILRTIRQGGFWLIGNGDNELNMGYATDMATGSIRAAQSPTAAGQAYNLCSQKTISQRQLIEQLCHALQIPAVKRKLPPRILHWVGFALEACGHAVGQIKPPLVTRHDASVFSRPAIFSSDKAKRDFDWEPKVAPLQGLSETIDWIRHSEEATAVAGGALPPQRRGEQK